MPKKIRARGATLAPLYVDFSKQNFSEQDSPAAVFRRKVSTICPEHSFDEQTLSDLYLSLSSVIGKHHGEKYQPEAKAMANKLAATAKFLRQLGEELSLRTGITRNTNTELAIRVREALELNPTVANRARADEKLGAFCQDSLDMSQACWVAFRLLSDERGKPGRTKLVWYDDFTALLLRLAKLANINPRLAKDRKTDARTGWLFEAAQSLESLLYPEMRSPSAEACGKRLERSLRRLRSRHRQ
jgi:hypothetical protein